MPTPNIAGLSPGNMSIYGYPNAMGSVSILGSGYTITAGMGSIPGSGYIIYSGPGSIPGVGADQFSGVPASSTQGPCDNAVQLAQLEALIESLYDLIANLFPASTAKSGFIAAYSAPARTNPFTYVRFAWIKANPGKKLYNTLESALAIKDMYLALGMDGSTDPLILKWLPPVV
jgi:hypothetical protein